MLPFAIAYLALLKSSLKLWYAILSLQYNLCFKKLFNVLLEYFLIIKYMYYDIILKVNQVNYTRLSYRVSANSYSGK